MPKVGTKHFPYTKKGKEDADKYRQSKEKVKPKKKKTK